MMAGPINAAGTGVASQHFMIYKPEYLTQIPGETLYIGVSKTMNCDQLACLIDDAGRPKPTEADLKSLEAALGVGLPDAYRAFLLTTPGGIVRGNVWFSDGESDIVKVKRVAGLTARDDDALIEHFRTAAELQTPEDALAIATDPSGNDLVMVLRGDRMGEILLLDHEMAEYGDRVTIEAAEESGYASRLAGSFADLVAGCAPARVDGE